ncbi:hypothetical protein P7C70_g5723, partial [Phenoliferia sp. Uapishka_3]
MRVIVTGASGLLGRAVFQAFKAGGHDVTGTAFTRSGEGLVKVDLQDKAALERLIKEKKPEVVVHCAAERRPDVAEKNPDAVQKLNVDLPAHLSSLSASTSNPFFLIYISTDYVFDGHARPSGYEPDDPVAPTNLYGKTKEEGEQEVLKGLKANAKGTVLRVPVLYGEVENNAESAINILLDITRQAASGEKQIKMDHWAIRVRPPIKEPGLNLTDIVLLQYPTNVADVARVLVDIAVKSFEASVPPILHFSAQERYTKYEICALLAKLQTPPLKLSSDAMLAVEDGPKPGETVRPQDCHLANTELEKLGIKTDGVVFADWWKEWFEREQK